MSIAVASPANCQEYEVKLNQEIEELYSLRAKKNQQAHVIEAKVSRVAALVIASFASWLIAPYVVYPWLAVTLLAGSAVGLIYSMRFYLSSPRDLNPYREKVSNQEKKLQNLFKEFLRTNHRIITTEKANLIKKYMEKKALIDLFPIDFFHYIKPTETLQEFIDELSPAIQNQEASDVLNEYLSGNEAKQLIDPDRKAEIRQAIIELDKDYSRIKEFFKEDRLSEPLKTIPFLTEDILKKRVQEGKKDQLFDRMKTLLKIKLKSQIKVAITFHDWPDCCYVHRNDYP